MKKVYVFFAYLDERDMYKYPVAKRYYAQDHFQKGKQTEDGIVKILYAWTTDKTLKRLFVMDRSKEIFQYKPLVVEMEHKQLEGFEKEYGGRQLSLRGIEEYKLSKTSGIGNILGTEDEFSYVAYDFMEDSYTQNTINLLAELPPADIFNEEIQNILEILKYPIRTFMDYEDPYWSWNNYEVDFNEYALFIRFFSNLYKKCASIWRDDI